MSSPDWTVMGPEDFDARVPLTLFPAASVAPAAPAADPCGTLDLFAS